MQDTSLQQPLQQAGTHTAPCSLSLHPSRLAICSTKDPGMHTTAYQRVGQVIAPPLHLQLARSPIALGKSSSILQGRQNSKKAPVPLAWGGGKLPSSLSITHHCSKHQPGTERLSGTPLGHRPALAFLEGKAKRSGSVQPSRQC